jgi:hypothetical protein
VAIGLTQIERDYVLAAGYSNRFSLTHISCRVTLAVERTWRSRDSDPTTEFLKVVLRMSRDGTSMRGAFGKSAVRVGPTQRDHHEHDG